MEFSKMSVMMFWKVRQVIRATKKERKFISASMERIIWTNSRGRSRSVTDFDISGAIIDRGMSA